MTNISVLKRYAYKGVNIAIRKINLDVVEYLFAVKGSIYTQSYSLWSQNRKLKEIGAATLIVCNAAESVVDIVLERRSWWYRIGKALGFTERKVEEKNNETIKQSENQEAGHGEGPRADQGHEGPPKAP